MLTPDRPDAALASLELEPAYAEDLAAGRLASFARRLAEDGMAWWCEFRHARLARHLSILREAGAELPTRVGFLDEISDRSLSQPGYLGWQERFLCDRDLDAACVAAAAALADIWYSGADYRRAGEWLHRGDLLLDQAVSPLPRAAFLVHAGVMEMLGGGDLMRARQRFAACRLAADAAASAPLRVFLAAMESEALLWAGEYASAEVLLTEAAVLTGLPDLPAAAGLPLRASLCRFLLLRGDAAAARSLLQEDLGQAEIAHLPGFLWLEAWSPLLLAHASEGDEAASEELARGLRQRLVRAGNGLHPALLHLALGAADLLLGRPALALAHARLSRSLAEAAHSVLVTLLPALLEVQARGDVGDLDGALAMADAWMDRWEKAGMHGIAAAAAVEMAGALARLGRPDRARASLEQARALSPPGEEILLPQRPHDHLPHLLQRLLPAPEAGGADIERYPVAIRALGELRVRVGDHVLHDRDWRGERAKTLLKALLVLGGRKVPGDRLAALVWPDADIGQALGNLKVALWRLRRLGADQGNTGQPWLLRHQGRVSLARGVAAADSLLFQEAAEQALRPGQAEPAALLRALSLYEGDFLGDEGNELWIIDHRQRLRDAYLACARALAEVARDRDELELALSHLQHGHDRAPFDELVAASLMRCYLRLGFPGRAIQTHQRVARALKAEWGIEPGAALAVLLRQADGSEV